MPVLQFKGRSAVECYHHSVPHRTLESAPKLSVLGKIHRDNLAQSEQETGCKVR